MVIPCLDDEGPLTDCLRSLMNQTRAPQEIIVVDNGCSDNSVEVARRFGARVIAEPVPGIPAAAAAGYDAVAADIIARCDADSVLPADWLARLAAHFEADPGLAAVTGPGRFYGLPRLPARLLSELYMRAYTVSMGAALAHFPLFGSNLALRRSCWQQIRGEVHRDDAQMHDDVCLSLHLGLRFRSRWDPSLLVGISPRAIRGAATRRRAFRRAFHTLAAHRATDSPGRRWQRRLGSGAA